MLLLQKKIISLSITFSKSLDLEKHLSISPFIFSSKPLDSVVYSKKDNSPELLIEYESGVPFLVLDNPSQFPKGITL